LLLEAGGFQQMVQRILVIDCSEDIQLARTIARTGMNEQAARAIMSAQLSRRERLLQADDVIVNDLDMNHLKRQVEVLHENYLALANRG
jgi:dephospho-CoA kinase